MKWHLPVKRTCPVEVAQQQTDNHGAATKAQLQGGTARHRNRNEAEQHTQRQADGHGQQVRVAQSGLRVTEVLAHVRQAVGAGDHANSVRVVEHSVRVRHEVLITLTDTSDDKAVVEGLDLADRLTGNLRVGHGNATVLETGFLGQLHWVFLTQDLNGLIDGFFGAVEQVSLPLAQWHFRDGEAVALLVGDDTSSHHGLAGNAVDMASGVIEVLGQAHAFGYELGGNHSLCAGIFLMVHLDNLGADGGDENRADYRTWVGQGVTDDRGGIAHHFHHGSHARRGGKRTGEHTDGLWHA